MCLASTVMLMPPPSIKAAVLDCLSLIHIALFTSKVYEAIGHSVTTVERHLGPAMKFLTLPGVAETMFLKLVSKPSSIAPGIEKGLPNEQHPCTFSPSLRWRMLSSLSDWRIILRVARPVYSLDCSSVYSGVCADLFLQMLHCLCWDDNGELLLQPVSYCLRRYTVRVLGLMVRGREL